MAEPVSDMDAAAPKILERLDEQGKRTFAGLPEQVQRALDDVAARFPDSDVWIMPAPDTPLNHPEPE